MGRKGTNMVLLAQVPRVMVVLGICTEVLSPLRAILGAGLVLS